MGVRIVRWPMTNHRTSSVFVRHNIVYVRTFDWHFPEPNVADLTGDVHWDRSLSVALVGILGLYTGPARSGTCLTDPYDGAGRAGRGNEDMFRVRVLEGPLRGPC